MLRKRVSHHMDVKAPPLLWTLCILRTCAQPHPPNEYIELRQFGAPRVPGCISCLATPEEPVPGGHVSQLGLKPLRAKRHALADSSFQS
jgi:hypothetical protein